jgi:MFS family permease
LETDSPMEHLPFLLQPASRQVWVQAVGRSLYQAGYGSIQFFIPLIFVNQVGLSATAVGIGIGSGSLAGIMGHLLGGYLADSPAYGRKRALLFSAGLSILAAIALALTQSLPVLVVANLLMGLSAGCYWTAADATVIDVTTSEHRHKAFAILVLADSLGAGLGIWGGGMLLSLVHEPQILFVVSSVILVVFLALIAIAVTETRQDSSEHSDTLQGFVVALRDRSLILFVLVNVLFTTFIALVSSTLPLYFTNVLSISAEATPTSGSSIGSIANLYTWCYIGLGALLQVPLVQVLGSMSKVRVLGISMLLWGTGFILVWVTGTVASMPLVWAIASLSVLSIAATIYKPFAPAIVADLAPESLRGAYLAISYQCWSIGYFIGPVVGGWAMDQSRAIARGSWVVVAIGAFFSLFILYFLGQSRVSKSVASIEDTASVPQ